MAIASNGHILSLVLLTVMVSVFEIYRLVTKKLAMAEVWLILKGAILEMLLSAYSLYTMLEVLIRWYTPTVPSYLKLMLKNNFREATDTMMGLGISRVMLLFAVAALWQLKNRGSRWILLSIVIFVGTFNFVPGPGMVNTPLSTLQFNIRVWMFVALLLAIGIVVYLDEFGLNWFIRVCIYCWRNGDFVSGHDYK